MCDPSVPWSHGGPIDAGQRRKLHFVPVAVRYVKEGHIIVPRAWVVHRSEIPLKRKLASGVDRNRLLNGDKFNDGDSGFRIKLRVGEP